jgi:hypothetical protein
VCNPLCNPAIGQKRCSQPFELREGDFVSGHLLFFYSLRLVIVRIQPPDSDWAFPNLPARYPQSRIRITAALRTTDLTTWDTFMGDEAHCMCPANG